jgi:hypothetical protein
MKTTGAVISIIVMLLSLVLSCSTPSEPGILQGYVSIGPIQPVVRPREIVEVPCEVYEARKIIVYDQSGNKLIQQVDIDCDGKYAITLSPGTYQVDINRIGIDSSSDVPKSVEIKSGLTTRLDNQFDPCVKHKNSLFQVEFDFLANEVTTGITIWGRPIFPHKFVYLKPKR